MSVVTFLHVVLCNVNCNVLYGVILCCVGSFDIIFCDNSSFVMLISIMFCCFILLCVLSPSPGPGCNTYNPVFVLLCCVGLGAVHK